MEVLKINNLNKSFDDLHVLKGVSFNMQKGEVVAVIGASGGGKTTMLRCLTFLERADSEIGRASCRERVSWDV